MNQQSGSRYLGEEKNKQADAQVLDPLHALAAGKLSLQHS